MKKVITMIKLLVPNRMIYQIFGFMPECERSVDGAIHLKPGTNVVTNGEWEHIQSVLGSKICGKIQVLDDDNDSEDDDDRETKRFIQESFEDACLLSIEECEKIIDEDTEL